MSFLKKSLIILGVTAVTAGVYAKTGMYVGGGLMRDRVSVEEQFKYDGNANTYHCWGLQHCHTRQLAAWSVQQDIYGKEAKFGGLFDLGYNYDFNNGFGMGLEWRLYYAKHHPAFNKYPRHSFSFMPSYKLSDKFSLYVRVGPESPRMISLISKTKFAYGMGGRYDYSDKISLGLDYTEHKDKSTRQHGLHLIGESGYHLLNIRDVLKDRWKNRTVNLFINYHFNIPGMLN